MRVVTPGELEQIWSDAGMPHKRAARLVQEIIVHNAAAGDPRYTGGRSLIVKILTPNGRHIGTVHEIRMPDGSVPHSHPKDYTERGCERVRASGEA